MKDGDIAGNMIENILTCNILGKETYHADVSVYRIPLTDPLLAYDLCVKAERIFDLLGDTMYALNVKKLARS